MFRRQTFHAATGVACLLLAGQADAHPHVFIDGGVDFRFGPDATLEALEVTWRYDEFETLYMLSAQDLQLNDAGELDEEDRLALVQQLSEWPADFDGSAHPVMDGAAIPLEWPSDLDAHMLDGRLQLTFVRRLSTPLDMQGREIDVSFHESTYFFAFSLTDPPELIGDADACSAQVVDFDPDSESEDLAETLASLGREETPELANVGALFADRIVVRCD